MNPAKSNVVRRVGYYDANDGIFLEQNGTSDVAIVRRTSVTGTPVDNRVVQTNWNKDIFNGTGISGINLNLSTAQILIIDLQFLGVGRVRVGFDVDGIPYWAHQFTHANSLTNVYMRTANLPLRVEQIALTNAPAADMKQICSAVISSGGFEDDRGIPFSIISPADITISTATTNVISIRPKTIFGGQTNRATIIPTGIDVLGGSSLMQYQVHYNSGRANIGGTWISVNTNSVVEYSINAGIPTNSIIIESGFIANASAGVRTPLSATLSSKLPLTLDMNGANPFTLSIVVQSFGSSTTRGSISWKELK
jgi:hypothetical protein